MIEVLKKFMTIINLVMVVLLWIGIGFAAYNANYALAILYAMIILIWEVGAIREKLQDGQ